MRGIGRPVPRRCGAAGFTLIELAVVMVVTGLLLVPLLRMATSSGVSNRLKITQGALETARGALIAYAAANRGCLPFAADFEGGLPDTDAAGVAASSPDTGIGVAGRHAGDLPWADLGLAADFLDGERLRLQYYVAGAYAGANCSAAFRGFPYDLTVTYNAPASAPLWFYYTPTAGARTLYRLDAGASLPPTDPPDLDVNVSAPSSLLATLLLELRIGPDITSPTNSQNRAPPAPPATSDPSNSRNVFVLIAPGANRNADLDRKFIRDAVHKSTGAGADWPLGLLDVDGVVFSSEPSIDAADSANDGDDNLMNMTFDDYKAELSIFGMNMEPVLCTGPLC